MEPCKNCGKDPCECPQVQPYGGQPPQRDDHQRERAGKKLDQGKIDPTFVTQYFPRALLAVSAVAGYGARKYTRDGWRTVPGALARYSAAMMRHHLLKDIEGPYDEGDSGLAHLAQRCWNDLAELELALLTGAVEIRCGNDIVDGKPVLGTSKKIA